MDAVPVPFPAAALHHVLPPPLAAGAALPPVVVSRPPLAAAIPPRTAVALPADTIVSQFRVSLAAQHVVAAAAAADRVVISLFALLRACSLHAS